jgi:hypothetical protein
VEGRFCDAFPGMSCHHVPRFRFRTARHFWM